MRRLLLALALVASGCAPSLSPTYRDYRVPTEATGSLDADLRAALTEAGWEEAPSGADNVITTAPREIDAGLFSTTEATLDLAPLNDRFVRVYVHAIRRNVFGSRSKQPYLSPGLRKKALGPLTEAMAGRGLIALDEPRERDEEATD